jgi:hypothetical protein
VGERCHQDRAEDESQDHVPVPAFVHGIVLLDLDDMNGRRYVKESGGVHRACLGR